MSQVIKQELSFLWNKANQLENKNPIKAKAIRELYWLKYRAEKALFTDLYMDA